MGSPSRLIAERHGKSLPETMTGRECLLLQAHAVITSNNETVFLGRMKGRILGH